MRPIAQSHRLKINNYGGIWLSLGYERARKSDCICLLDGDNRDVERGINCFKWITSDSRCASAYFPDQLNGLSILYAPEVSMTNGAKIIIIIIIIIATIVSGALLIVILSHCAQGSADAAR